ncbi:MAG: peptidylprolyl isomerase [Cytophagaceae bacterium]
MKKLSALFLISLALLGACKSSGTKKSTSKSTAPVLQVIGDRPVYSSEFAYVYKKNNSGSDDAYTETSVREYLRLYTNFKLKVRAAEEAGLDTSQAFIKELEGYKKQLAQPYFTEKNLTEKFALQAYDRLKEEINASHILIMLSPEADPKDTLAAFNKLQNIRQKALKGESFEKLAREFSEDPSAKSNSGNLGYFTALQMVYPFEDAVYNTKVGDISNPVRTRFGYHIIMVHDRRASKGEVQVAHLMVRANAGLSAEDSIAARNKIFELHKRLTDGEEWAKLVSQFSDDANSKNNGGELPWFSTGRMIPSFEEAAFSLTEKGAFTEPVLTPYGWHIIKFLDKKELPAYEELESKIKQRVSKDRSDYYRSATIDRLKKENSFKENKKSYDYVISMADSSLIKGKWLKDAGNKGSNDLFTIGSKKYSISDFFGFVAQKQTAKPGYSPSFYMNALYQEFVEESNIKYEEEHLEDKYEDYRMLVNEYRDGILLFQLMDERVWSKAIQDTSGLRKFFNENNDMFKWEARAKATIYSLNSEESLSKLKEELKNEKFLVNKNFSTAAFATGKTELSDDEKTALNKVLRELTRNKDVVLEITGYADQKELKNRQISSQRAEKVKEFIISKGIAPSQVVVKDGGKGKSEVKFALYSTNVKDLEKNFNQDAPLTLQITKGLFQKNDNEILQAIDWKVGEQTIKKDGRVIYVVVSDIEEPRQKTFDESRGLAISDYQVHLEENWLKDLRAKYPVIVNEEEVKKLIKK